MAVPGRVAREVLRGAMGAETGCRGAENSLPGSWRDLLVHCVFGGLGERHLIKQTFFHC